MTRLTPSGYFLTQINHKEWCFAFSGGGSMLSGLFKNAARRQTDLRAGAAGQAFPPGRERLPTMPDPTASDLAHVKTLARLYAHRRGEVSF
jgi:hypothetical protein